MADSALQELVCCMGQPVAGNPTQFMMEKAFVAAGLDWRYLTLEVPPENLADAVETSGARRVDVSSGVESKPGEKDPARIKALLQLAKSL